jgi:zinc/manganese transport system substrate-binding protein
MTWNGGRVGRVLVAGAVSVVVLGLAACGGGSSGSGSAAAGGKLSVVASTNVWGDIAATVGGDAVEVTSVISSTSQDPHSFTSDTRTQLAVSKADLVIENGGGYDDFMDQLLKTAKSSAPVINAVEVSGQKAPSGGELNEHVWYDFPTVQKVADSIATDLGRARPAQAADFTANAKAFDAQVDTLIKAEATAKAGHAGEGTAITEPVPLYLLEAMGLVNQTPAAFSEAVEESTEIPVAVLDQTLKIFSGGQVKVFVYNEQTSSPETDKVLAQAKQDGVPTVGVTETLPAGKD